MIGFNIIFWISISLLVYTYALYPMGLVFLNLFSKKEPKASAGDYQPLISVLIAAHNEEKVIEEKIRALFSSDYPLSKLEVHVGSDDSSDSTNAILSRLQKEYKQLRLHLFSQRTGKPGIINQLASEAKGPILIITDANVIPAKETLRQLVSCFEDPMTGLADTKMVNLGKTETGISFQEKTYISWEVRTKYLEGKLWGTMMGPFGGFFALRKECFIPVPATFLVDDFFLCLQVLKQKFKTVSKIQALVYEDTSNSLQEEMRRKTRISTGNFQNLRHFAGLLRPPYKATAICWFSHKILRWMGPLWLTLAWASSVILHSHHPFYLAVALLQTLLPLLAITDLLLKKINLHFIPLRFVTHFYAMNIALFKGFMRYTRGVDNNIWQPTRRFQVNE